jgi:UDP-N-acetylmuramyl pentapeptide phosphotransferase/UDP-N-acetylglucosamine-1-phosphate transferase
VPTPQGAGVAVIAATILVACIYQVTAGGPVPLALFGATIFIAVVGFVDDERNAKSSSAAQVRTSNGRSCVRH